VTSEITEQSMHSVIFLLNEKCAIAHDCFYTSCSTRAALQELVQAIGNRKLSCCCDNRSYCM